MLDTLYSDQSAIQVLSETAAVLHRNGYTLSTIRRHAFRKWSLQAFSQRDLGPADTLLTFLSSR
jgi:hypothetical protein